MVVSLMRLAVSADRPGLANGTDERKGGKDQGVEHKLSLKKLVQGITHGCVTHTLENYLLV